MDCSVWNLLLFSGGQVVIFDLILSNKEKGKPKANDEAEENETEPLDVNENPDDNIDQGSDLVNKFHEVEILG